VKPRVSAHKSELAQYARKAAEDRLTLARGGNLSARIQNRIYIKAKGVAFEDAKPTDFVAVNIKGTRSEGRRVEPSFETKFHVACYKKRPDVNAVIHTHPVTATTIYSAGIKLRPVTLEFALYIGKSITTVDFYSPGTKRLAVAVGDAVKGHDAVVLKKHGLITIGRTLQEAYLKTLIIERECRAQLICKLYKKSPPYLTEEELKFLGEV